MKLAKRFLFRTVIEGLVYVDRLVRYIDYKCKYHYIINHPVTYRLGDNLRKNKPPRSFVLAMYHDRDKILEASLRADREDPVNRFAGRLSFGDPDVLTDIENI